MEECRGCLREAKPGFSYCDNCLEKHRQQKREFYIRRKSASCPNAIARRKYKGLPWYLQPDPPFEPSLDLDFDYTIGSEGL